MARLRSETLKLSAVIEELWALKAQHGDLPVALWDADTGWLMSIAPGFAKQEGGFAVLYNNSYGAEIDS